MQTGARVVFQANKPGLFLNSILLYGVNALFYWGAWNNVFKPGLHHPLTAAILLLIAVAMTLLFTFIAAEENWVLEIKEDALVITRPWLKRWKWFSRKAEVVLKPSSIKTIEIREIMSLRMKGFVWDFISPEGKRLNRFTTSGKESELHDAIKAWAVKHDTPVVFKRKN